MNKMLGLLAVCAVMICVVAVAEENDGMLRIVNVYGQKTDVPGGIDVVVLTNQNATCGCDFDEKDINRLGFSFNVTGETVHKITLSTLGNGTHMLYIGCINETSLDSACARFVFINT